MFLSVTTALKRIAKCHGLGFLDDSFQSRRFGFRQRNTRRVFKSSFFISGGSVSRHVFRLVYGSLLFGIKERRDVVHTYIHFLIIIEIP